MDLPRCCSPLQSHWPWPEPLDHAVLVSTVVDTGSFRDDDFPVSGIACPETLTTAAGKRKAEYLAGRVCAREALRLITGQTDVPRIGDDRAPVWPAGNVGTITHGGDWAGAMVAARRHYLGLGMDVERRLTEQRATRLLDQVLTPDEKARHAANPGSSYAQLVTLTFSLKESLFKALYPVVKRRFYFQDAELLTWNASGEATLRLLSDLSAQWPRGRTVDAQFTEVDHRLLTLVAIPA
ncbi:MAG: 4'-phosphopantetheinyl transferase superfamily protein [Marinobacter sp.]|nr:4'-phosphopantetheinyl transferase superfamily protein [Marinobacter sp.]